MISFRSLLSVACVVVLVMASGCSRDKTPAESSESKVEVVATVFPLADVVRRVGGANVEVGCLLGAGRSPHDFEAGAEHAEMLARAKLLVMVGLGVDEWAERAARSVGKKAAVLRLGEDVDRKGSNPHVWLDPVFMQRFTASIAEALIEADPDRREDYLKRRDAYVAELKGLDEQYRTTLAGVRRKHFVTYHAAFTYIARRYGLEQVALHDPDAGGFGAERIETVARFIKEHRIKTIFIEPQFPPEKMSALAGRTGAKVARLDPLGNENLKGYDSYLSLMRSNLQALASALEE